MIAGKLARYSLVGCLTTATGQLAHSVEKGTALGYTGEYSTNINQSPTDSIQDFSNTLSLEFSLAKKSSRLDMSAIGRLAYVTYSDASSADEFRPQAVIRANGVILPRRLGWTLEDVAQQSRIEQLIGDTPDNVQTTNTLSTGPDVLIRFKPTLYMTLEARYGNFVSSESDNNNNSLSAGTRLFFDQSATNILSLHGEFTALKFDNETINQSYDRVDLFARTNRIKGRSQLRGEIGGTLVYPEGEDRELFGLLRFEVSRQIRSSTSIGIRVASEVNDQGRSSISVTGPLTEAVSGPPLSLEFATAGFFLDRTAEMFYRHSWSSQSAELSMLVQDREFTGAGSDELDIGARALFTRALTNTMTGSISGNFLYTEFGDTNTRDRNIDVGGEITHRLTRDLFLNLGAVWRKRESNNDLRDFTETRAFVSLVYRTGTIGRSLSSLSD